MIYKYSSLRIFFFLFLFHIILIICLITLNCIAVTQTKRLRKEINYILIHNNTLKNFVWSNIALNIHVPILKTDYYYLRFLHKSDSCISCFRNDGEMKVSKVHRTCRCINWGSLKITHVFNLSIISSCRKKIL